MSPHPQSRKAKARQAKKAEARRAVSAEQREERRAAHEARVAAEERQRVRRGRTRTARNVGLVLVAGALLAGGAWALFAPDPELDGVERIASAGRDHVQGATYDEPAPTSGPHNPASPRCGTYREPLALDLAVHALEHGVVVLWHDPAQPELVEALETATAEWDSHVIIAPNDGIDADVVATAWNRRKAYDAGDPEITEFVDTYRRRGPERVDCDR